jgi:radical SAM-linked protein
MVSWKQKAPVVRSAFDKFDMEPLKEPVTVRLRFRKTGDLQYISHLDLQRVMSRVLIRSGVPIWFTQCFNPHPKMVFGMPLSVGAQSECEYLDVKIDRKISLQEILERLNAEVTREMHFKAAYYPSSKLSDIALVKYVIEISEPRIDSALAEETVKLLTASPLIMMKRTKSGEKEVDITSFIKNVSASAEKTLKVTVTLAGGEGSLNPEMLVTAMREKLGVLKNYPESGTYTIMRTNVYFADGREFE